MESVTKETLIYVIFISDCSIREYSSVMKLHNNNYNNDVVLHYVRM